MRQDLDIAVESPLSHTDDLHRFLLSAAQLYVYGLIDKL